MWAVWHLERSSNLPDILRVNQADGIVTAELFQSVKECSPLQTRGASDSAKSLLYSSVS